MHADTVGEVHQGRSGVCAQLWSPQLEGDVEKLERVRPMATKMGGIKEWLVIGHQRATRSS